MFGIRLRPRMSSVRGSLRLIKLSYIHLYQPAARCWIQPDTKGSPLTSPTLRASFSSLTVFLNKSKAFCSIGQLFTLHHQRRILAPIDRPLSFVALFQWRQPCRARVQSVPWMRGRRTCLCQFYPFCRSILLCKAYLVPYSNKSNLPVCIRALNAPQITLLEPQIWQGRQRLALFPRRWTDGIVVLVVVAIIGADD